MLSSFLLQINPKGMKGGESMTVTEKSVKTSAVILNILAENKCTVAEAEEILSFCSKILSSLLQMKIFHGIR